MKNLPNHNEILHLVQDDNITLKDG